MFDLASWNATKEDYIGATVFWTIRQCLIPTEKVAEEADNCGFELAHYLNSPSEKRAFTRTAKSVGHEGGAMFARKISDRAETSVIGIVREQCDEVHDRLEYEQTTTARFHKDSHEVEVSGSDGGNFMERYRQYCGNFTDGDIRMFIRKLVGACGGVALRPSGGVYFVPRSNVETVVEIDRMLKNLGVGIVYIMRVPNGTDECKIAWDSAKSEAVAQIESVMESVDKIQKQASRLSSHQDRLDAAKKLMVFYSQLTHSEAIADEILERFQNAENAIATKIDELEAAAK